MKLVSMKYTEDEKEDKDEMCCSDSEGEEYPYCMRLRISEKEMKKLGIALPSLGQKMSLAGIGKVVEVYASDGSSGERQGFEFIITDLGLEAEGAPQSVASRMFKGMK